MVDTDQALGPMDPMIFTVPPQHPDVRYAVLRRYYATPRDEAKRSNDAKHRNDSRVFAARKLHPISRPLTLDDYRPEVRHEVLLPDDAEDRLADPKSLFEDYEAKQVPNQKDLVTHVKLSPPVRKLHHLWEDGRQLAKREFVEKESMAVLMIMHVPQMSAPHLHLLIPTRRLSPTGWVEFVQELARDSGCLRVSAAWAAFRRTL